MPLKAAVRKQSEGHDAWYESTYKTQARYTNLVPSHLHWLRGATLQYTKLSSSEELNEGQLAHVKKEFEN